MGPENPNFRRVARAVQFPVLFSRPAPPPPSPLDSLSLFNANERDLKTYQGRAEILYLLGLCGQKKDSALRLAEFFFDPSKEEAINQTLPFIDRVFEILSSGNQQEMDLFLKSLDDLQGKAVRYFADPLFNLIQENQTAIAIQILLAYLAKTNYKKAQALISQPLIYNMAEALIEYKSFPTLFVNKGEVDCHIRENLRGDSCRIMLNVIPEAYKLRMIDSEIIKDYCNFLFTRVAYPGTRLICLDKNKELLHSISSMLNRLLEHCDGIEKTIIEEQHLRFQSFFILDEDHLSKPQYRKGELVGLHEYPQDGRGSYEIGDKQIHVRVKYPQLETPCALTAPIAANVEGCSKPEFRQKISTFSRECPDVDRQIKAIDSILRDPINDPEADPSFNRRYIGMFGKEARVVYTNERKVGTSFSLPLFEMRSDKPEDEVRVIPDLKVRDEEGEPPRSVRKFFSPQKKLFEYVQEKCKKDIDLMPAARGRISNQELPHISERIREILSSKDGSFKRIPTKPGGPVLIQVPLSACGVSANDLFNTGYRSSGKPTGITKRLTDDEIAQVFDPDINGMHVILHYPDIDTFTRLVIKSKNE